MNASTKKTLTGTPMIDLLTPEEAKTWLGLAGINDRRLVRLCRDYLTLWDRNNNLQFMCDTMEKSRDKWRRIADSRTPH